MDLLSTEDYIGGYSLPQDSFDTIFRPTCNFRHLGKYYSVDHVAIGILWYNQENADQS